MMMKNILHIKKSYTLDMTINIFYDVLKNEKPEEMLTDEARVVKTGISNKYKISLERSEGTNMKIIGIKVI